MIPATLIVDIGGTLIWRDQPGAYTRVVGWLAGQDRELDPKARRVVADMILTGAAVEQAADLLAAQFTLDSGRHARLRDLLEEDQGQASILPDAERLLDNACQAGWRVLAVTNAARWVAPLPPALTTRIGRVISSAELGMIKQDPKFWPRVVREEDIDPCFAVVVGDDRMADGQAAWAAGLAAIIVNSNERSVAAVADALVALGPRPSAAVALLAGIGESWGARTIVRAPHMPSLVKMVTRARVKLHFAQRAIPATVVRRRDDDPVVHCDLEGTLPPLISWIVPRDDRQISRLPADLRAALVPAGLSLDDMSEREQRYLLSLVHEAREPVIRKARIESIVEHLQTRGGK